MLMVITMLLPAVGQVFGDLLKNAFRQRIGNYDVQLATDPNNPMAGSPTRIKIRIAGVNGDELLNTPIQIRLVDKQNTVLQWTSTIIVPAGHYFYNYTFPDPARYVLYIDLKDSSYSNSILTFTFFVNVVGQFSYLYTIVAPTLGGAAAGGTMAILFIKKRKHKQLKTDLG
jgi:hypothetical protein